MKSRSEPAGGALSDVEVLCRLGLVLSLETLLCVFPTPLAERRHPYMLSYIGTFYFHGVSLPACQGLVTIFQLILRKLEPH